MAAESHREPAGALCVKCATQLADTLKTRLGEHMALTEKAFQAWEATGWRDAEAYEAFISETASKRTYLKAVRLLHPDLFDDLVAGVRGVYD